MTHREAAERDHAELVAIFENLRPMASGAEKELAAVRYLETKSVDWGYGTKIQELTVISKEFAGMGMTLITTERREFVALPMLESELVDVSGFITLVGRATPRDMPE